MIAINTPISGHPGLAASGGCQWPPFIIPANPRPPERAIHIPGRRVKDRRGEHAPVHRPLASPHDPTIVGQSPNQERPSDVSPAVRA